MDAVELGNGCQQHDFGVACPRGIVRVVHEFREAVPLQRLQSGRRREEGESRRICAAMRSGAT